MVTYLTGFFNPIRRMLSEGELWGLAIMGLGILLLCASIVAVIRRLRWHDRCQKCKYDLRGSASSICSECGTEEACRFRFFHLRPYFGIAGLLLAITPSFFISWPSFWIGVRMAFNDGRSVLLVNEEIDLGHGVVVQDCSAIVLYEWSPEYMPAVRVLRDRNVIYNHTFYSSAEYYKIEDLNGNGTLDFRYGYGAQGTGRYESSLIIDPLYDKTFGIASETFIDTNDDGILECIERVGGFMYQWNYGVDKLQVYVTKFWDEEYGKYRGWEFDLEANRTDPPSEQQFQEYVFDIRDCIEENFEHEKGIYLGCIAPKMASLCYSGHPALAFDLLDKVWLGSDEDKLAFEHEFIEVLRKDNSVDIVAQFGLFDEVGRRACQDN